MNLRDHLSHLLTSFAVFDLSLGAMLLVPKTAPQLALLVDPRSEHNGHRWNLGFKGVEGSTFRLICVGDCCQRKIKEDEGLLGNITKALENSGVKFLLARNASDAYDNLRLNIPIECLEGSALALMSSEGLPTLYDDDGRIAPHRPY